MKYLHCGKPMETIDLPNGPPVGMRCVVCFEVVPNILLFTLEE